MTSSAEAGDSAPDADPDRLTLVIPTYARPEILRRKLCHLARTACPILVVVVDSSPPEMAAQNRNFVETFTDRLRLVYRHLPSATEIPAKIHTALCEVRTPYVVLSADDDFVDVRTALACVTFLESHADYVNAAGHYLFITKPFRCGASFGAITVAKNRRHLHEADPMARIRRVSTSAVGSVFYNVWRTHALTAVWMSLAPFRWTKDIEYLFNALSAAIGPTAAVDRLFAVRERDSLFHRPATKSAWQESGTPFYALEERSLLNKEFGRAFAAYLDAAAPLVAAQTQQDPESVRQELHDLFVYKFIHRSRWVLRKFASRQNVLVESPIARSPVLRFAIRLKNLLPSALKVLARPRRAANFVAMINDYGWRETLQMLQVDPSMQFNIHALLSGSSRYSEPFKPIYETWRGHRVPRSDCA